MSYYTQYQLSGMGVGKGAEGSLGPPGFWKFQHKNVVFLIFSGKKQIPPLLAPPWEKLWKTSSDPPLEKILLTPVVSGQAPKAGVARQLTIF